MTVKRFVGIVISGILLLTLGTYLAGERTEIAVLRTFDDAGAPQETKLWVAEVDGVPYVRIGRAGSGWGERLKANPEVELVRAGDTLPCTATLVTDAALHRSVDEAFAVKYGWVDWWYGVVLRRDPVPVRLSTR